VLSPTDWLTVSLYSTLANRQYVVAIFSNSRVWNKGPEGSTDIFRYPNFPKTQCSMGRGKPVRKKSARAVQLLGPFYGAIAVPSVTRCRCCRRRCCCGHRCAGSVRQWRHATVATPGEWQCKTSGVRRLAVANGPNIFQMLVVLIQCRRVRDNCN